MSTSRIRQGLAKVVFKDRIFSNGKNFFWIRLTRAWVERIAHYWRRQKGFYYMKIYAFNRRTREIGQQLAAIGVDYIRY